MRKSKKDKQHNCQMINDKEDKQRYTRCYGKAVPVPLVVTIVTNPVTSHECGKCFSGLSILDWTFGFL